MIFSFAAYTRTHLHRPETYMVLHLWFCGGAAVGVFAYTFMQLYTFTWELTDWRAGFCLSIYGNLNSIRHLKIQLFAVHVFAITAHS